MFRGSIRSFDIRCLRFVPGSPTDYARLASGCLLQLYRVGVDTHRVAVKGFDCYMSSSFPGLRVARLG